MSIDILHKCAQFEQLCIKIAAKKKSKKSNRNDYHAAYMREKKRETRNRIIKNLGGECSSCGSKKNLHVDHKKPKSKKPNSKRVQDLHSVNNKTFEKELKNLQLLCDICHKKKTHKDWNYGVRNPWAKGKGTEHSYRKGDRRPSAIKAHKEYLAKRREKRKEKLKEI